MALLFTFAAIALGLSFLCSVLEAVLLSVTPSYLARLEQERPQVGARLRGLKTGIDRPLAAILSLNTVAHTVGAAGVGAEVQRLWGSHLLAITTAVLTLLILLLSEIVPKTLGAVYWDRLAPATARVLPLLIRSMLPLVWLSELVTRGLRGSHLAQPKIKREEFAALARLGSEQGVFDESESRILKGLFRLGALKARDVMTPRTVLFALSDVSTVAEAVGGERQLEFSRIPVFRKGPDDVVGYVLKDDLLLQAARGEGQRQVGELARQMMVVPDGLPVPVLFERLLEAREHIALVVDEYGGVDGVVTMEDVLETLLGLEIVDESDTVRDLRDMARLRWRQRAERLHGKSSPALFSAERHFVERKEGDE